MDSAISTIVSLLCAPVVAPVYRQINYVFLAGSNVKALRKEIDKLKTAKGEVERKITTATATTDTEAPTDRVQKWLGDVKAAEDEVTRIEEEYNQRRLCFGWCTLNCWSNYNISKQAAVAISSVKDLIGAEEKFGDAVTMRCAPTVRRMPTMSEASPAVRSYLETASDYLQDDSVGMIGIYGMGGVGKTSLLRRINNHPFVAGAEFDHVIWLVASQDLNLKQLQKDMAKRLGLPLEDDATIEERGQSLYLFLKHKKFLLLLDDIWEPVDLEKLGITFQTSNSSNNNGALVRKVVFTTRSEGVCNRMMAGLKLYGRKLKVECMQQEEAWQLFLDNVGHEARDIISSDERVRSRAKRVADKCGGLPLALVGIGRAMSSKKTLHEWEDAINSLEEAFEYLQDDGVGVIGIHGMGGVGKTSLLQRINNPLFVAAAGFDHVICLVASQDLNLNKLQNDMADRLGLRLRDDATIEERGQSLYFFLKHKKFLLLLDDIWELVDVEKLGITITFPTSSNNNDLPIHRLVFTTRSEGVCDRMMAGLKLCGRKVKVECMQQEEAWQLFLDNVGHEARDIISSDERVRSRAKRVADKCGGLPLALIVIGQAMSSNKTLHEWEDAIHSIEKIRMKEMWSKETDPFPLLKISYDRLPSESMRKCFLRCAMWPEDASIFVEDLVRCWIGMDLIEEYDDDINAAYSRGNTIIQWLIRAGLLEEDRDYLWFVKLHDIIRGMALWIASDYGANNNKWIVPGQAKLMGSTSQDLKRWREAETISMMFSGDKIVLPEHVSCPNLSALILTWCSSIRRIPDGFFLNMPVLTYLDLSRTGIKELPPAIRNLVRLRHLDLSLNELHSLPKEAAYLVELKHLILWANRSFQFPPGLISRLEKLEVLDLNSTLLFDDESEASIELEHSSIKRLDIAVKSFSTVERISQNKSISFGNISICDLKGVTSVKLSQSLCHSGTKGNLKSLHIVHCLELEEISAISQNNEEFENLEHFGLWHLPELKKFTWGGSEQRMLIRNVRELVIKGNRWLKNLTWILHLPYLENLYLVELQNLEKVIGEDDADKQDGDGEAAQIITVEREVAVFSRLKSIYLVDLPSLCSFSSRAVAFHRLTRVDIFGCPQLDETPFSCFEIERRNLCVAHVLVDFLKDKGS